MNEINALILVGGRGSRLKSLTKDKTKSFVSFFSKYRIIDFPLSSISYSNIKNTGIITQYQPFDLMKYIGGGASFDLHSSFGGISFLTPYENNENNLDFQKGTANACLNQIEYIKNSQSPYILILPGDQIYKIDFRKVLNEHKENKANLTIITTDINEKEELNRYGIIEYDESFRITGFTEKPDNPKTNHISLGMYLFNKDFLIKCLEKADVLVDFGHDLIPYILSNYSNIYAYKHDSYFYDLGTVDSLYKANMFFLDNIDFINKKGDDFKIYSRPLNYPPHIACSGSTIKNSIIGDASIIKGEVIHSVVSYKCTIEEGSMIKDSILLPKVKVGKNTKIENAIIDEGVCIKDNQTLIFDTPTIVEKEELWIDHF